MIQVIFLSSSQYLGTFFSVIIQRYPCFISKLKHFLSHFGYVSNIQPKYLKMVNPKLLKQNFDTQDKISSLAIFSHWEKFHLLLKFGSTSIRNFSSFIETFGITQL